MIIYMLTKQSFNDNKSFVWCVLYDNVNENLMSDMMADKYDD